MVIRPACAFWFGLCCGVLGYYWGFSYIHSKGVATQHFQPTTTASSEPAYPNPNLFKCGSLGPFRCGDIPPAFFLSQSQEDQILIKHFFPGFRGGFFLEMGALDGLTFSNTNVFEKALGWNGLLIEANPIEAGKLNTNRPAARAANTAVCSREGTVHWVNTGPPAVRGIYEFMSPTFKSRWHANIDLVRDASEISCSPLTTLLASVGTRHLDIFSLDVEGGELEVLKTFPFSEVSISVLFHEADGSDPQKELEIYRLLVSHGAVFVGRRENSAWFVFPFWFQLGLELPGDSEGFININR